MTQPSGPSAPPYSSLYPDVSDLDAPPPPPPASQTVPDTAPRPSEPSEESSLTCPICLCEYVQATDISCGHSFCARCILQHLASAPRSNWKCPSCRTYIVAIHPAFTLREIINRRRLDRDEAPEVIDDSLETQLRQRTEQLRGEAPAPPEAPPHAGGVHYHGEFRASVPPLAFVGLVSWFFGFEDFSIACMVLFFVHEAYKKFQGI